MLTDICGNFRRQKYHGKAEEKKLKYKSIFIQTQRMWNLKCDDSTRNSWSHRIAREILQKNLEDISGKHSIDSLYKASILGTSHTVR